MASAREVLDEIVVIRMTKRGRTLLRKRTEEYGFRYEAETARRFLDAALKDGQLDLRTNTLRLRHEKVKAKLSRR